MFYWSSDVLYPGIPSPIPINTLLDGKTPSPLQNQKTITKTTIKDPQNGHFGICYNHICWDCIIKTAFGKLFDIPNKRKRYIRHTAWSHVNWAISVPPQYADCKNISDLGALSINAFLQTSLEVSSIWVFALHRICWVFVCMGYVWSKCQISIITETQVTTSICVWRQVRSAEAIIRKSQTLRWHVCPSFCGQHYAISRTKET